MIMKRVASSANAVLIAAAALLVSAAASANNGPVLHPNAQLYHVQNPSAATGRSGSASLTVRALLGKDGETTVDVTTGTLDSAAVAPGNIDKIQFKAFNEDGEVRWTKNDANLTLGGELQYTFDDLHRGHTVETQAKITGIDGQRADVVTVTGDVKLRPDLFVKTIDAPAQAALDAMVNIASTIYEINGDVGATGDCVLLVDGAEVDRAEGIYVDSGSAVTCAFTHTFDTAGTHALAVRVTDVVPGDWDTSNNEATGSIEIVNPQIPFYWNASAYNGTYIYSSRSDASYSYWGSSYAYGDTSHFETNQTQISQQIALSGSSSTAVRFPLARVTARYSADGAAVASLDLEDVPASWSVGDESNSSSGLSYFDPATHSYVYIDTWSGNGQGFTWAQMAKYGGAVTYFSQNYSYSWYSYYYGPGYWYAYNSNSSYGYTNDTTWPMTSTAAINLEIEDANGDTLEANAEIPLLSSQQTVEQPYTCNFYYWGWGNQHYCSGYQQSDSITSGFAAGMN
jgi:hypothetical protein